MPAGPGEVTTNPTIFLRLNASDPQPREFAWDEFSARYAPVISGFAHRLGARPQDVDDLVQEVMLGFFLKSPTFVYDPAKGRFRSYLKVCTYRALLKRIGADARFAGQRLDDIDPEALAIEQVWNDVWEQERLRRALDELRRSMGPTRTFQAFEQHVIFAQPAQAVADKLGLHLNSVYRAADQVTQQLQQKLASMRDQE